MKRIAVILVVAAACAAVIALLLKQPEPAEAGAQRSAGAKPQSSVRSSRIAVPVRPPKGEGGKRLPGVASSPEKGPKLHDEAMKQAFANHPKKPVFEKRINALKAGARGVLGLMSGNMRDDMSKFQELSDRAKDKSLTETERAAIKAEMATVAASVKQEERNIDQFRREMETWLQDMVREGRDTIIGEIKNPPPTLTAAEKPVDFDRSLAAASSKLDSGDYAAAEADFISLAAVSSGESAALAQWQALLCRTLAGKDIAAPMAPLMNGGPSSTCYALAVQAISQGGWEEAGIWVQQAASFGTAEENAPFNSALQSLGWMDSGTGKLIPPEAGH